MEWTPDLAAAEWLVERVDDSYATIHGVVPRGFDAYARIFHPASVRTYLDGRESSLRPSLTPEEFKAGIARIVDRPVTWAQTAQAFGTTFHPLAQWHRLVGREEPWGDDAVAADGREYSDPEEGRLADEQLSVVARCLADATATPDDVYAAVWEGWGGIVGSFSTGPHPVQPLIMVAESTGPVRYSDACAPPAGLVPGPRSVWGSLVARVKDALRRPQPVWRDGRLSREISEAPRLQLPDRDHVLFRGRLAEFTAADAMQTMPWNDPESLFVYSPSLIWPADRAWVVVTEVDFDSTVVGGSARLVDAICSADGLEALPIPEGSSFCYDADTINGPD